MAAYFSSLREAASSAAEPASQAAPMTNYSDVPTPNIARCRSAKEQVLGRQVSSRLTGTDLWVVW